MTPPKVMASVGTLLSNSTDSLSKACLHNKESGIWPIMSLGFRMDNSALVGSCLGNRKHGDVLR